MKIKTSIFILIVCWQAIESINSDTQWSSFIQILTDFLSSPHVQLNLTVFAVKNVSHFNRCRISCYTIQSDFKILSEAGSSDIKRVIEQLKKLTVYGNATLIEELERDLVSGRNASAKAKNWVESRRAESKNHDCLTAHKKEPYHCFEPYPRGIPVVNNRNSKTLLDALRRANRKKFGNFFCWADARLRRKQLEQVNAVLKMTLGSNADSYCRRKQAVVYGNVVATSRALTKLAPCERTGDNAEVIVIMATDRIYIDRDVDLRGRDAVLAIMAPVVVVMGERKIVLDGSDNGDEIRPRGLEQIDERVYSAAVECALEHYPNEHESNDTLLHKWLKEVVRRNDKFLACSDELYNAIAVRNTPPLPDGEPGPPGQRGGSFIALADVIEESSHLVIRSHGGRGGFGQHGAHGAPGKGVEYCTGDCPEKAKLVVNGEEAYVYSKGAEQETGTNGADGGDGGVGGGGGKAGQVLVITLKQNNSVVIDVQDGGDGRAGLGGIGGRRGFDGERIVYVKERPIKQRKQFTQAGRVGIDGKNTDNMQTPSAEIDLQKHFDAVLHEYRTFLGYNLDNEALQSRIFDHLLGTLQHSEILNASSAFALARVFLQYEKIFPKLHDKLEFIKLYDAMLDQTETKAESVEGSEKQILLFVYTAVLAKIHAIKEHTVEKYIANLDLFLVDFKEKLERYEEVEQLADESARYKQEIDQQIEDTGNVVSDSVMPKLEVLFVQIDQAVDQAKAEVGLEEDSGVRRSRLLKKERNLFDRLFANILSALGTMVSCLGSIGAATGKAMQVTNGLAKSFRADQDDYEPPSYSDLIDKLNGLLNAFDAAKKQKEAILVDVNYVIIELAAGEKGVVDIYNSIEASFRKINNETGYNKQPERRDISIIEEINNETTTINVVELESAAKNSRNLFEEAKEIYQRSNTEFRKMKDQLSRDGDVTDTVLLKCEEMYKRVKNDFRRAIKRVGDFDDEFNNKLSQFTANLTAPLQTAFEALEESMERVKNKLDKSNEWFAKVARTATKLIRVMVDTGSDVLMAEVIQDRAQVEETYRILEDDKESIQAIRKFGSRIDEHVKPMLESMKVSAAGLADATTDKSEVHVLTSRWQVESTLDKLIATVAEMAREFGVGEAFKAAFRSMREAVSMTTNVYKKLQDCGDTNKLADYMVAANAARRSIRHDRLVRFFVARLTVAVEANLLLGDYRNWLKQIKLFVFPFPQSYLRDFRMPSVLQPEEPTLDNYIATALEAVEKFRSHYTESLIYVDKYDRLKHRALFYSNTYNGPFFVWKRNEYQDEITRLLVGESVYFEALVARGDMNAVKFRRIELVLKTQRKLQPRLDNLLKNYVIRIKHLGNSHYGCNNKTYSATIAGQMFKSSYEHVDREPIDANLAYTKTLHGDYMLSPYTTWQFRLISVGDAGYRQLQQFQGNVDLELCGEGEYFEDSPGVCQDDLSAYSQTYAKAEKTRRTVVEECPETGVVYKEGYLSCEKNERFDPTEGWCRAVTRKPDALSLPYTGEDSHYVYYDRFFRHSILSEDDLSKLTKTCSRNSADKDCLEKFTYRQAYRPWFFYDDKAGGPFSESYLYCHKQSCLARLEKPKMPLENIPFAHQNSKFYFYSTRFQEFSINDNEISKFVRCSPVSPECASAFENSALIDFKWDNLEN